MPREHALSRMAIPPMNSTAAPNARSPARRASGVSPAPTAQPTSTEPAFPTPSAKQKVTLAMVRAIWCAPMSTALIRPARNPASANTPTSAR